MEKQNYILKSFLNAAGVFLYTAGIAWFLSNGKNIFGEGEETFIIPLFMLLLLIISATVTGFLVLGNPLQLYLAGSKKEAFTLLLSTVGWLVIFLLGTMLVLLMN